MLMVSGLPKQDFYRSLRNKAASMLFDRKAGSSSICPKQVLRFGYLTHKKCRLPPQGGILQMEKRIVTVQYNYDVAIVGSGVAGLFGACHMDPSLKVLVIAKREPDLTNTSLAQGGIAAVLDTVNDNQEDHIRDTMIAGGYENNPDAVRLLVSRGPADVRELMELGAVFDRNPDGSLNYTLEGGHCRPRIVHHKDSTGSEVQRALLAYVRTLPNVTIWEDSLVALLKKDTCFHLDVIQEHTDLIRHVNARVCLLATGGIGRVYEYTTNSKIATGDGIAFAYRLGARIKNLHYIQFHPTGFANKKDRETFLISESVRGEGGYLLNAEKKRFMQNYDPRQELAPRDVVSHFEMVETKRQNSNDLWLDISYKPADFIRQRFPMIYQKCLQYGYDMTKEPIPIYPCQHYLMGGIDVDLWARTTVEGLYAAGECSHTGVHGNNRLASNSLLEALVFSHRAAEDINRLAKEGKLPELCNGDFPEDNYTDRLPGGIRTEVRAIMQRSFFVAPNVEECRKGLVRLDELRRFMESGKWHMDFHCVESRSLVTVADLILRGVVQQEEAKEKKQEEAKQ